MDHAETDRKPATPISATEASRAFGDMLNRLRYTGEEFVITLRGRAVAALVAVPSEGGAQDDEDEQLENVG